MCIFLLLMKPKDDVKEILYFEMIYAFTQDLFFLFYRRTSKKKKSVHLF